MTSLIIDIQSMPLWFSIPLGIVYLAALAYFIYTLWHYRRKNNLILLLFTIASLASGQSAWAAEKTVTYTFIANYAQNNVSRWTLTFTRSGDGFGYSDGEKTATIQNTSSTTGFTVQLDDGLKLTYSQNEGHLTFWGSEGFYLNGTPDGGNSKLTITSSHYYVTHVKLANTSGSALTGTASPWAGSNAQLDVDVDMVTQYDGPSNYREFSASFSYAQVFGQLTVTYGDPREYAITFNNAENGQNGVTNTTPTSYNVTTNDFQITAPTRTGYTLSGTTYTDSQHPNATPVNLSQSPMTIHRGEAATRKAITFNASWTANQYTVTFDNQSATIAGTTETTATYDAAMPAITVPTKTGYTFGGYYTETNGGGTQYYNADGTSANNWDIASATTLYAKWTANTYTLRLHRNDGTDAYTGQTLTYDLSARIKIIKIRNGYVLSGWSTTQNGSVEYTASQSVMNLSATQGDVIDLYAQWTYVGIVGYPLTLEAIADGEITVSNRKSGMRYSKNGGDKSGVSSSITVSAGDIVEFYGSGTSIKSYDETKIKCTEDCYIYGNIMSLVDETGFATNTTLQVSNTFNSLFEGNTHLKNHSTYALVLPATALTMNCYSCMFEGCTSLTTAPTLPATTLAERCYLGMFNGCTSLTTAPALPATTLADDCYNSMFGGCTSLSAAPELPATTLADDCYSCMFEGCTSLSTAPALPATTLAERCYLGMFEGCSNLSTAPVLPATTLANNCYYSMFQGCTSLSTAPALPATTLAERCYLGMFEGCSNLSTAPELPATRLTSNCYESMFEGCTSLTTAPELPATRLTSNCYESMFEGCTNLTAAPTLPATTLVSSCYREMFQGCTKLNYVMCLAVNIEDEDPIRNWLDNVANSGTFVRLVGKNWRGGPHGIPFGWTVIDALVDNADNRNGIAFLVDIGVKSNVMLYDRTLYKDGDWNTIVLPFDVDLTADGCPLAGAEARTLTATSIEGTTLNLTFGDPVTTLVAGTPYIIKWTKPANYVAYDGTNAATCSDLVNPEFTGVTLKKGITNAQTDYVTFRGTYSPIDYTEDNHSILFLGTNNMLYYPEAGAHIGAFRCYFELGNGLTAGEPNSAVRGFNLNFDEQGTQTVIGHTEILRPDGSKRPEVERTDNTDKADAAWYSLDGVKLDSKPTQKGLYLHGGRKVVIK